MSKRSHAMESFSHFVVALIGGAAIIGVAAWAFMAFDDHGCSTSTVGCRTTTQMQQAHY